MAKEKPLISIICAVYNDKLFIKETMGSVVSQTYPNLEIIIMDGGSTDGTLDILKEYSDKYDNVIVYSESDEGQWHALDKALLIAKGEYLSIVCGQDGYLDNNWFSRCIETFEKNPEISLVWGIPINMSEDGKLLGPHYAYAKFLKDSKTEHGLQTRPVSTMIAKIDFSRPSSFNRLLEMMRKLTLSRLLRVLVSFKKQSIPQKEDWLSFWLRTGLVFPEGNLCVKKNVYLEHTVRFPEEKMTNSALLDFNFNFNTKGYLAYGLPIAASFGRSHADGQDLRDYDKVLTTNYYKRVKEFKNKLKDKNFKFVDSKGRVINERIVKI